MAKDSDRRQALEPELRSSVVNLTAMKARLEDESELERDPDVIYAEDVNVRETAPRERRRPKPRKKVKPSGKRAPSVHDLVDRSIYLPIFYDLADRLPTVDDGPGRPRLHPLFMILLYVTAAADGRSYSKTDGAFDNEFLWHRTRRLVNEAWNNDSDYDIGAVPINYSHACRYLDTYVVDHADVIEALYDAYVSFSVDLAHRMEIMRDVGSYMRPDKGSIFIGDGTVVRPLFKASEGDQWYDPVTGEVGPLRYDADARFYRTGDNKTVYGQLWATCHIRSEYENERVNLGFARVPRGRGDGAIFADLVTAARPHFPFAKGAVYDMALDGPSINRLYMQGLIAVTKVSLGKNGLPATARIQEVSLVDNRGYPRTVTLWAFNGALVIESPAPSADLLVRIDPYRIKFSGPTGAKRAYGYFRVPDVAEAPSSLRGCEFGIRLDQDANDLARRSKGRPFDRATYFRAFPEGHATYDEIFGLREDAESDNNLLKQSLWNKRSRSLHADRQFLDMLGFRLNRNIRALMAHEARTGVNLFPEMEHGRPSLSEVKTGLLRALKF